jgi:hypothetical protein
MKGVLMDIYRLLRKSFSLGFAILVILSFLLSACGFDDEGWDDTSEIEIEEQGGFLEYEDGEETQEGTQFNGSVTEILSQADSGFRPERDGFSFENYGDDIEVTNLTEQEMRRMFGDQVCSSMAGGQCTLTPPAQQWMNMANKSMAGGHCEGFAVLSSLFYYQLSSTQDFGGQVTADLSLRNEMLQREIAYWFATQMTYPGSANLINESPAIVVDTLVEVFSSSDSSEEWWVLGIYQPDFSGGHAITPIAVEDKGNGLYDILVYDNNFPGQIRSIEVNYTANTWSYMASTNPNEPEALYEGDADTQTLEIVAVSPRLAQQNCDFCLAGAGGSGLNQSSQNIYEIWLEGSANLLIIDEFGQKIGNVDGKFVNEIPGALRNPIKLGVDVWGLDYEPVYRIPAGRQFEIVVQAPNATQVVTASLSMIGPGFFMAVDNIWLEPGTADSINVAVDGSRHQLTYITDYADSPEIMIGVETDQSDYVFLVQATELRGENDTFDVAVDLATQEFILNTSFNTEPGFYDFYVLRIDDAGMEAFGTLDFEMAPDSTIYLQYANWGASGDSMIAEIDYGNDGLIDDTIELPDMADEFVWD